MEQIVITGMGCVCPLGNNVEAFWDALIAGQSGIAPLTKLDPTGLRNETGGEVKGFDWNCYGDDGDCDEASQFAFVAAQQAARNAGLTPPELAETALIFSTNFGGAASWEAACDLARDGESDAELLRHFSPEHAADYTAARLGCKGARTTLSNACSSGGNTIGLAIDWLRLGRATRVLAGGHDSLGISSLAGLSILRTISPDEIRPFDKARNGTIFGEGAGILLLETESAAQKRGAKILARALGWAVNNNAYHLTAPDKEGAGLGRVMEAALRDAEISPAEIGYINAHGTGTQYNDLAETQAIARVLAGRAMQVPVSSIKAATSHTMAAAGALEAIATVRALQEQMLPPTINYQTPDPNCPLDYVPNIARAHQFQIALSNSSGIGGNNACLVLGRQ